MSWNPYDTLSVVLSFSVCHSDVFAIVSSTTTQCCFVHERVPLIPVLYLGYNLLLGCVLPSGMVLWVMSWHEQLWILVICLVWNNSPTFSSQDEREAREMVKREQDEAYRLSLEADRKKVCECSYKTHFIWKWLYNGVSYKNPWIWPFHREKHRSEKRRNKYVKNESGKSRKRNGR